MSVMNGASAARKIRNSRTRMKSAAKSSDLVAGVAGLLLLVHLDRERAGQVRLHARRRRRVLDRGPQVVDQVGLRVLVVLADVGQHLQLRRLAVHARAGGHDTPRSFTLTTVGTLPRSVESVASQAWSAAVNVPLLTAAITGTGISLLPPNGAASVAACSLGALAGRKLLLFP